MLNSIVISVLAVVLIVLFLTWVYMGTMSIEDRSPWRHLVTVLMVAVSVAAILVVMNVHNSEMDKTINGTEVTQESE